MLEDSVTQQARHLVGNHWGEKASTDSYWQVSLTPSEPVWAFQQSLMMNLINSNAAGIRKESLGTDAGFNPFCSLHFHSICKV